MAERRTGRVGLWALAALTLLQVTRALEGSLGRLHAPGLKAGYGDLLDSGDVNQAWGIWTNGAEALKAFEPAGPKALILWHVVADVGLTVCILGAMAAALGLPASSRWRTWILELWRRLWGRFALMAGALGLAVNVGIVWIALASTRRSGIASVFHFVRLVELVLVGLSVLALALAGRGAIWKGFEYFYKSPAVLRVLLALDIGFVVVVYAGAIGSQTEDVVQRWLEGHWLNPVAALAGYCVFVFVVRSGRFVSPIDKQTPRDKFLIGATPLLVLGLLVWRSGWSGRGTGLLLIAAILLVVGICQRWLSEGPGAIDSGKGPLLRGVVAAIPAVAMGLLLVRTGVNHAVVGRSYVWLFVFAAIAFALATGAWALCSTQVSPPPKTNRQRFAIQAAAVTGLSVVVDVVIPDQVGSFAILLFALAELAAVALAFRAVFLSNFPPKVFRVLGFRRTPVVTVVVAWVAIASVWNASGNDESSVRRITYYDARITPGNQPPIGIPPSVDTTACVAATAMAKAKMPVQAAFCTWVAARAAGLDADAEIPLVLVTASGGGVRAAAWTEKVLDCLFLRDDPVACAGADADRNDRWPQLFAANGASGGSVGIASTVAERLAHVGRVPLDNGEAWFRRQQRADTLGPLLGHAVLRDTILGLFGIFAGEDRATALEDAWSERWRDDTAEYCLGAGSGPAPRITDLGFVALRDRCARPVPYMLFNGTDENTGRRVNLAPADLDDTDPKGSDPDDLRAPADLIDYLGTYADGTTQDLPLFTAAFLSARFPLVTPSGRLPSCRFPGSATRRECPTGTASLDGAVLNVVDGGYAENYGVAQVAELWEQLSPLIDAYNAGGGGTNAVPPSHRVRAVLVEIENGERPGTSAPALASTRGELFRPMSAFLNAKGAGGAATLEALRAGFDSCGPMAALPPGPVRTHFAMYEHPGRTLPLGWTLARDSLNDLDHQFQVKENGEAASCFATAVPAR